MWQILTFFNWKIEKLAKTLGKKTLYELLGLNVKKQRKLVCKANGN